MNPTDNRREFLATCAALLLVPSALVALEEESQDRDLTKILTELPQSRPHIDRIQKACKKYARVFSVPPVLAAKVLAIESSYNPDAISRSFAVGTAQFMHPTARELGAHMPGPDEFKPQDEVLVLRRQSGEKMNEAVAAFRLRDDKLAASLRTEAQALTTKFEKQHEKTMADFKKRMFAMSSDDRRAYDARFDPATSDDMVVHYLATLARGIKKEFDSLEPAYVLLLAGVAYNAGPGNVIRKPGIPVVAQNVEYANKLMLFQTVKL